MPFVLDPYAARSCPLKTFYAHTPGLVAPEADDRVPLFFHDAASIEATIVDRIVAGGAEVVDLRGLRGQPSELQERAALDAMARGVDVVVHPLLPRDWDTHRSGRPTLAVRAPDGSGYRPVQAKFHRVLESSPPGGLKVDVSPLTDLGHEVDAAGRRFRWVSRFRAALQVAHYWRLLDRAGFAAATARAGIIGLDQIVVDDARHPEVVVTWLDLDAALAPPDPFGDAGALPLSTLERYDAEHALRVDLADAARAGTTALPLTPVISGECRHCVWLDRCTEALDPDDVSLRLQKSPLGVDEIVTLRRLGVSTVGQFAHADLDALLPDYLPRATHRDADIRLRKAQRRARLMHDGVELERLDDEPIDLPRHDLEIDIDIETSAGDRVYLWGFWVDDGVRPSYREFVRFDDLDDAGEHDLAHEAFTWLREVTHGRDVAVYHYSDYETIRIRRVAGELPDDVGAWAVTFASTHFVDLFDVMRRHFFGANGLGLKVVAGAATGFEWRDEDPGGLNSQRWFDDAVHADDADVRALARTRVLEYNEDDVIATWHLRRWLRELT